MGNCISKLVISLHIGNLPKNLDREKIKDMLDVLKGWTTSYRSCQKSIIYLGPLIKFDIPRNKKCRNKKCRENNNQNNKKENKQCCHSGFAVITVLYEKWQDLVVQLLPRDERRDGRMQEYCFYYGMSDNDRFDISVRNPLLDKNKSAWKYSALYQLTLPGTVDPFLPQNYEYHRHFWKSNFL